MGVAEWSRDHVEGLLSDLERQYGSFPVDQTTVTLPSGDYQRVASRCRDGIARIDIRVLNDDGDVLMVETDGELTLPGRILDNEAALEREAQIAVHQQSGVECVVEGVDRATIAGVSDQDDPDGDRLYRLLVLMRASHLEGDLCEDCQWQGESPSVNLIQ